MFKIYDGREQFYQWDLNRKLVIEDKNIKQVHFCNKTDDCSLVCETYLENGLLLVNVPNVLLQDNWRINVYAYDSEYTKHYAMFKVVARSKPADYIYTETELLDWRDLEDRIKELEQSGGTGASIDIDQAYNPESANAQSGKAVAEAISGIANGLDLENLTLSVEAVENNQRLSMSDGTTTKSVDIPVAAVSDEQVETIVNEYLESNPITTITPDMIEGGKIFEEKIFETAITDGQYCYVQGGIFRTATLASTSVMAVADIIGGLEYEYTAYDEPLKNAYKICAPMFKLEDETWVIGEVLGFEKVEDLFYVIRAKAPNNAVEFATTIYTSKKDKSYVKTTVEKKYTLEWLELPEPEEEPEEQEMITKDRIELSKEYEATSEGITVEFEDGKSYGYYANTQIAEVTLANYSVLTANGIKGETLYQYTCYANPETTPQGQVVWFDKDGNVLRDFNTLPFSKLLSYEQITNTHYRVVVISPKNAVSAKITIYTNTKEQAVFQELIDVLTPIGWLKVNMDNIPADTLTELYQALKSKCADTEVNYHSVVRKGFDYSSKKVALFGDSIAVGVSSGTTTTNFKTWANQFKEAFGLTLSNKAVSGTCITNDNSNNNSICEKVLAYTGGDDVVIVAGGTNDHTMDKPLGEYGDTEKTTFYGALYEMCEHLKTLNAYVVFITPINKANYYSNPYSLNQYRNAIHETVLPYGFSVVEGSEFPFPTEFVGVRKEQFLADGVHPTEAGHTLYFNSLCNSLM